MSTTLSLLCVVSPRSLGNWFPSNTYLCKQKNIPNNSLETMNCDFLKLTHSRWSAFVVVAPAVPVWTDFARHLKLDGHAGLQGAHVCGATEEELTMHRDPNQPHRPLRQDSVHFTTRSENRSHNYNTGCSTIVIALLFRLLICMHHRNAVLLNLEFSTVLRNERS